MIEKSAPPVEFFEEVMPHIDYSLRRRPEVPGLAIDSHRTLIPEDAIFATKHKDGSFSFVASIVESGMLDPNGESIGYVLGDIENGVEPRIKPPRARRLMTFFHDHDIPALSLVGGFRPDIGFFNVDIIRTKLNPRRYSPNSTQLRNDPYYPETASFVHAVQTYEFERVKLLRPGKNHINGGTMVDTFATIVNLTSAQLAEKAKLPQLVRVFPVALVVGETTIHIHQLEINSGNHADMFNKTYGGLTAPIRNTRDWVNSVMLTYFMETGQPLLTDEKAQLLADWLNSKHQEKIKSRWARIGQTASDGLKRAS
jgi:hypothetical protein